MLIDSYDYNDGNNIKKKNTNNNNHKYVCKGREKEEKNLSNKIINHD